MKTKRLLALVALSVSFFARAEALTQEEIDQIESDLGIQLSSDQIDQMDAILNPSESAQWRTEAMDRIEQHRKANVSIRVRDANGEAIEGAQVEMKLRKSAFKFGGVVHAHDYLDRRNNLASEGGTAEVWERIVKGMFNSLGTGNNFKPKQGTLHQFLPAFLDWSEANELDVRGHLLIWPGTGGVEEMDTPGSVMDEDYGVHLSHGAPESLTSIPGYENVVGYNIQQAVLDYKASGRTQADKDALEALVDAEVTQWASLWDVYEWDVINETISNYLLMDILGYDQMAEWFKIAEAHKVNPETKLLINDFQIISAMDDPNAPAWANYFGRRDGYMASIDRILADGGKIDRIGFQNRYKYGKPDPAITYNRLMEWSDRYGMEMVGTEFEVVDTPTGGFAYDFSEEERAEITEQTTTLYYSHPLVTGFFNWTFMEDEGGVESEKAIAYYDGTVKLNGLIWYYLHRIRFATEESGASNSEGEMNVRGFKGDYEVTVTYGEKEYAETFSLSEEGAVEVTLDDVKLYSATDYYDNWLAEYPGLGNVAMGDDTDGDEASVLREYAFGGNPEDALDAGYEARFGRVEEGGIEYLEYVYGMRVDAAARGLNYVLESSTSLAPDEWLVVEAMELNAMEGDEDFLEVKSRVPALEELKQFFRLRTVYEP